MTAKFKPDEVTWLSKELAENLIKKYPQKINNDGEFVVQSSAERTQEANLRDCLKKIQNYISDASFIKKKRIETEEPQWVKEKAIEVSF